MSPTQSNNFWDKFLRMLFEDLQQSSSFWFKLKKKIFFFIFTNIREVVDLFFSNFIYKLFFIDLPMVKDIYNLSCMQTLYFVQYHCYSYSVHCQFIIPKIKIFLYTYILSDFLLFFIAISIHKNELAIEWPKMILYLS